MTKILATVHKPSEGNASIEISTRAVYGSIEFVGSSPTMLSHLKDKQQVHLTIKPVKK
jgi:hypothetical protein